MEPTPFKSRRVHVCGHLHVAVEVPVKVAGVKRRNLNVALDPADSPDLRGSTGMAVQPQLGLLS